MPQSETRPSATLSSASRALYAATAAAGCTELLWDNRPTLLSQSRCHTSAVVCLGVSNWLHPDPRYTTMSRRICHLVLASLLAAACAPERQSAPGDSVGPDAGMLAAGRATYRVLDLGSAGGPGSIALSINGHGVVVGYCTVAAHPDQEQACVWRRPGVLPPELLDGGGLGSQASDINDAGDIVGLVAASDGLHATLWPAAGGTIDLGRTRNTTLPSINTHGDVVWAVPAETGDPGPTRVALYRNGIVRDLGVAVPNQGGGYGSPAGISDDGLIAVIGGTWWKRNRWLPLARPDNVTGDLIPWRVTADGEIVGQLGGGLPASAGLWWPAPGRVRFLGTNFVAYDRGRAGLVGEGLVLLPGGMERTVAATFTPRRGMTPLPAIDGYDPRGRAIRVNRSGWIAGFTVRPDPDQPGRLANRATLWIPE